jgi:hypothetical protein
MPALSVLHKLSDLPFKSWNFLKRNAFNSSPFSKSAIKSDSEGTFYQEAVENILASESQFKRFRRKYDYREILEHVDFELGQEYFLRIKELDPQLKSAQMALFTLRAAPPPLLFRGFPLGMTCRTMEGLAMGIWRG